MEPVQLETVAPGKSPLASRTVQVAVLALVTALVSNRWPAAGEWIKAHNEEILTGLGALVVVGRNGADKPLNWRDWTIKGIGFRF